jgi:retron-type reverse transcriptase
VILSEPGNLRAGVPQGSVLDPLLFLLYVNDIADEVLGLCMLFADDTSIGHSAHDLQDNSLISVF